MVERRDQTGEDEGMILEHRAGEGEAQILGRIRHRGYQQGGVVYRNLSCLTQRGPGPSAIDVEDSKNVGEKNASEFAAFQQPTQFNPRRGVVVFVHLITRIAPK